LLLSPFVLQIWLYMKTLIVSCTKYLTRHCLSNRSLAVVLVLDLSKPNELWTTMEKLLQVTRNHVNKILTKLQKTNPEVATEIKQRMRNNLQRDHPVSYF